jgi:hypothetical protein
VVVNSTMVGTGIVISKFKVDWFLPRHIKVGKAEPIGLEEAFVKTELDFG